MDDQIDDLLMQIRLLESIPGEKEKFVVELKDILTKIVLMKKEK